MAHIFYTAHMYGSYIYVFIYMCGFQMYVALTYGTVERGMPGMGLAEVFRGDGAIPQDG